MSAATPPQCEPIVDPDAAICDPHHHLWRESGFDWPPYHTDELNADLQAGHNVVSTVFVECGWAFRSDGPEHLRPVGETEDVAAAAAVSPIRAIVAYADLTLPTAQLGEVLDAHESAGAGLFRGIRDRCAYDENASRVSSRPALEGKLARPEFRRGLATLAARGYTFDAWLFHPQLADLLDAVGAVAEASIVLDHLGGPLGVGVFADRRDEVMAGWRDSIAALAACPNVTVKLGGIGMVRYGMGRPRLADGAGETSAQLVERWGDHIRFVIDTFGPQRCMFESNFPVDRDGADYVALWNAFKLIAAPYSPTERAALLHDTAARVYRVGAG
jgi:L-fuconolactonase